ncbi:hypothetical protein EAY27_02880 [Vibrio anguillarum]|uniref:hypothetical protein n=5 Tax=Vibrio anguillarum TaxID=55601 RepID=UPI001889DA7D|nr:hypothetical protein [Vibrio anguillarum]MBF4258700.1 hypothetical protein [Vibrio anguillarum]MBF4276158.1 hypothetical protein [Vibrio anguillarum]MBF4300972.1 hypothetical protein [Vibrio anguillarum]MBF4364341.1 hypothetical protein [Vibrio anguillarum]MBF4400120.1 hypothetical protein [Vibrio anguillarum]
MQVKTKIKKKWFDRREKFPKAYYLSENMFLSKINSQSNNDDLIKEVLSTNPLLLIETTIPLIRVHKQVVECTSAREIGDLDRFSSSFGVFLDGQVKGFSRLTGLDIDEYGIKDSDTDIYNELDLLADVNDSSLSLSLHDFSRFNGKFTLVGSFQGDPYDFDIMLTNKIFVKAKFWGVPSNIDSPSWVEYLIDATINYMNHDYKMAALNYFSAYESFVSTIHDEFIFERFARKALKTDDEFNDARKFSQNRKRLSAKATDVAKYLGLFDQNLKRVINKLADYADKRNLIAHGTTTTLDFDVSDMAYYILTFIYTIGYRDNVLSNDWKNVINTNT